MLPSGLTSLVSPHWPTVQLPCSRQRLVGPATAASVTRQQSSFERQLAHLRVLIRGIKRHQATRLWITTVRQLCAKLPGVALSNLQRRVGRPGQGEAEQQGWETRTICTRICTTMPGTLPPHHQQSIVAAVALRRAPGVATESCVMWGVPGRKSRVECWARDCRALSYNERMCASGVHWVPVQCTAHWPAIMSCLKVSGGCQGVRQPCLALGCIGFTFRGNNCKKRAGWADSRWPGRSSHGKITRSQPSPFFVSGMSNVSRSVTFFVIQEKNRPTSPI
jgi:hypothetical protein